MKNIIASETKVSIGIGTAVEAIGCMRAQAGKWHLKIKKLREKGRTAMTNRQRSKQESELSRALENSGCIDSAINKLAAVIAEA